MILIIGANGLVGREVSRKLSAKNIPWQGTYYQRPEKDLSKLNITHSAQLEEIFSKTQPRAVIHCANLSGGVNFCETHKEFATAFHFLATQKIGMLCKEYNSSLIFISTDYVFDGLKKTYDENSTPNPLNIYGKLKLSSEEWIQKNLEKYVIVRSTNIYGWDPKTVTPNYMMNLYSSLKNNKIFEAPSYLWGNQTYVEDLAESILELYSKKATGLFHIVGKSFIDRFTWATLASKILEVDSRLVHEVKHPPSNMIPRPLQSNLGTKKFSSLYNSKLHSASEGLQLMKKCIITSVPLKIE